MDPQAAQQMDEMLMQITQRSGEGVDGLLNSVFGFLQRRTDFFYEAEPGDKMGFPPTIAEQKVLGYFKKFQKQHQQRFPPKEGTMDRWKEHQKQELAKQEEEKKQKEEREAKAKEAKEAGATVEEIKETGTAPVDSKSAAVADQAKEATVEVEHAKPKAEPKKVSAAVEEMQKMSTYNGAKLKDYSWAQTAFETSCQFEVPQGTKGKDLDIVIKPKHLSIKIKSSGKVLCDGEMYEKVKAEESYWSLEDGKYINITMEKAYEAIWKCLIIGDEEIDPKKVDNAKRVDEFDIETQGHLKQVFYEQDRMKRGLPTTNQEDNQKRVQEAMGKMPAHMNPMINATYDPEKYGNKPGSSGVGPSIPFRH